MNWREYADKLRDEALNDAWDNRSIVVAARLAARLEIGVPVTMSEAEFVVQTITSDMGDMARYCAWLLADTLADANDAADAVFCEDPHEDTTSDDNVAPEGNIEQQYLVWRYDQIGVQRCQARQAAEAVATGGKLTADSERIEAESQRRAAIQAACRVRVRGWIIWWKRVLVRRAEQVFGADARAMLGFGAESERSPGPARDGAGPSRSSS
jgi:hypothetical protein